MFVFLHIQNLISMLLAAYPMQLLLVGLLVILGLYQVYLFTRVEKRWDK